MDAWELLSEIRKQQALLEKMADDSIDPLRDDEIYQKSCEIDILIVRYMELIKGKACLA
ncbi:MAG: Spo0E family sporulation regulatory protein-aspartic acid phosphatase [Clostridia bacterium]|nr:Spo0E family sporulation regulatory protein-aspartic acid phosphatase [Clostridia bacterium]